MIVGLVAIADDEFYVVGRNYTFDIDTTAFGWIHLLIGLLLLANFFFIRYYPFWSILVIALDVWVIWAITRPRAMET
jgi:hypothetical protein